MSEPRGHTPGPWHVVERENGAPYIASPLGSICDMRLNGLNRKTKYANAEFIVRACNSHDDLLAACKALVATANELKDDEHGEHADDCTMCQAVAVADEAIAKAEQEPQK